MFKKITQVVLGILVVSSMVPLLASAHEVNATVGTTIAANITAKNAGDNDANQTADENANASAIHPVGIGGVIPMFFTKGTVSAVSSTGFTMTTPAKTEKDGSSSVMLAPVSSSSIVVNTSGALLIRLPNTVIALSAIAVGDQVFVQGQNTSGTINAIVVYDLQAGIQPARAKGTVTAVTGSTLIVQAKNGQSITVNTDANTSVTQNGSASTVANVAVGSKVGLAGLWNSVLNVFNAIRIRIFAPKA